MDILFIVPYVPNLIRVRPYNLIRHLTEKGHRVTVMTLWSNNAERLCADDLRGLCHEVVALPLEKGRSIANTAAVLPSAIPLQANYCWQPQLAQRIENAIWSNDRDGTAAFDVVHIEHLRGARYGLHLLSCFGKNGYDRRPHKPLPIVWDSVDSITHLFRQSSASSKKMFSRMLTWFELGRTEKYEAMLAGKFDRVLVTSKNDREAFLKLPELRQPTPDIQILPNGVDMDYFAPDENIIREPNTLVISGKMSYHANVSMVLYFVNQILPKIRVDHPAVKLIVVGKDPPRDIMALSQEANITVTGTVHDIRPYLRQAAVAVAPLTYGAGIQNKVLEAMACGTPVVSTSQAVSALDVRTNIDLLTATSAEDFAQKVITLLKDPSLREEVGQAGRAYVEQNHSWLEIIGRLENVYRDLISEQKRAAIKDEKFVQDVLSSS